MKKNNFVTIASYVAVAAILSSCGGLGKMKKLSPTISYTVTPQVLEMHADSVAVQISVKYPAKYFSKKAVVETTPVLKYDGGEKAFPTVTAQGESVTANAKVVNFTNGGSITYTGKIPYSDDMKISTLEAKVKASIKTKSVDFDPVKIASGVKATPALLKLEALPIFAKDNFKRIISDSKGAAIYFALQQSTVNPKELSSDDVKALKDYIKEAEANSRKQFKGINISSYASPEGPEDLNSKLADNRGKEAEKLMKAELAKQAAAVAAAAAAEAKKNKTKVVAKPRTEPQISTTATAEDWDGFKQMLSESNMADKELILRVLSMNSDPVVREKEIKNIAAAYTELKTGVLPKLRRSKMSVNVDLIGWSDSELDSLFNADPAKLTIEEILYLGGLKKKIENKVTIYKKAVELFPTEWRTHNNLGATYISMGKAGEAKTELEKAKELDDKNTLVIGNLGAVELMSGNFDKALDLLTKAAGAGQEVTQNTGAIYIKKAKYKDAVSAFGGLNSFNAALAKLLNGDNDGAIKTLDAVENKEDAMLYYLKAVAGARKSDTDIMYNNLRTAISKDASLAAKAKKDIEFGKYFEDDTFKSIAK